MPHKTYTEEFRRDAVALYENSPGHLAPDHRH
ncbi:hypothetical protein CS176_0382 [Corynebacterium glutamicum]|nr:hypothetical protein CS176_0382 [Corynebacterium glutamicum]